MNEEENSEINDGKISEIEKKLIETDPKLFGNIPKSQRNKLIKTIAVSFQSIHIGPIPAPDTLKAYSELIPNGAERIMIMAEKQLDHRMDIEKKVVKSQMAQSNLGQIFAFIIGIVTILGSIYCVINGHEWGSIIGVAGLTGLVTVFIKGRNQQERNLEEKLPKKKSK